MSTRAELRQKFRDENPELDARVVADATLNSWMKTANGEVCVKTRCLVSSVPETFSAVADLQHYDLESLIDNFLDIDDLPGGGVYYNGEPLTKSSPADMNAKRRFWRSAQSATPRYWWLRGSELWFDVPPDDTEDIDIEVIYLPDAFDADAKQPFNEQGYLQVYDEAIIKYLQWRAKGKAGKTDEAEIGEKNFEKYVGWMKKSVGSMKAAAIQQRPKSYPTNG